MDGPDPAPARAAEAPRICLSMIVRDEARVLPRCLAAAAPLVDALVLCDTGSIDDTPAIAERFGREHGIPTWVHRHAWVDFGHNRTRALDAARDALRVQGWSPARVLLLLLDADQVLEVGDAFDRRALQGDAYAVAQQCGADLYWNVRLVRADRGLRYRGATHEYLELAPGSRTERLSSLAVVDLNDGGARADKLSRDLALLTASLERDPDDVRTMFYLARTYRALGDRLRALAMFRRRIEGGGWFEEVWHSWFASAEILHEAGDFRGARRALAAARRVDPARAEGRYLLAKVHRMSGQPARGAGLAWRGLRRPFPEQRALFVDRRVYAHGFREELALSAPGTPRHDEGWRACETLVGDRSVPAEVRERAHRALLGYVRPWQDARWIRLPAVFPKPYAPCNPSIVATEDGGYLAMVRGVNYRQQFGHDYQILDPDGVVRSRNALLRLTASLEVVAIRPLHGEAPPPRTERIRGFEDLRLLASRGTLLAVATTADRHPSGRIGPSLLRLAPDGRIMSDVPLVGFGLADRYAEKNWLPYEDRATGEPRLIYSQDPFKILSLDPESGRCAEIERRDSPDDRSRWRGSGGPVPFQFRGVAGALTLVHEAVGRLPHGRSYVHRFAWRADDRATEAASRAFVLRGVGIEFAAGMCLAGSGADLLIGVGIEDREAWLVTIPSTSVVSSLEAGTGAGAAGAGSA